VFSVKSSASDDLYMTLVLAFPTLTRVIGLHEGVLRELDGTGFAVDVLTLLVANLDDCVL
jgi:hypothetical protein